MKTNNREIKYIPHIHRSTKMVEFSQDKLVHSEIELPLGWHEHVEIIRILEGEGEFIVSGKTHRVRAGSFIIINPNQIHSAISYFGRPLRYQSLKFLYDYFDSPEKDTVYNTYIKPLKNGTSYLPSTIIISFPIHSQIVELFDQIDSQEKESYYGSEIGLKILLLQFIHTFYKNKFVYHRSKTIKPNMAESIVKDSIDYLHLNYQDDLDLNYMCTLFDTTKAHLCRTFKRMTNQTITEYLNNYRIQQACTELIHTDEKIVKIAFDVGYKNISYFHERFKQKTFMTPNEYRDIYKKG